MGLMLLIILSIFLCWSYGDWKNWKLYYPTILYLLIGSLTCDVLVYQKPLWSYTINFLNGISADFLVAVFIYPCTVILFLTHYPKPIKKQVTYLLLWVFIYSSVEYIASITGGFVYFNGWTIGWSILFNIIMFPLLVLHYKRPLWAWPISMALAFIVLYFFKIPFESYK